jgi:hypothetical protein
VTEEIVWTAGFDPSETVATLEWAPQSLALGASREAQSRADTVVPPVTAECRMALVHAERFGPFERREGFRWAGSGQHDWAGHYAKALEQCTIWVFIPNQMVKSCP